MNKEVYSLCFMCSIRCPIKVTVKDGHVEWIEGNPNVEALKAACVPKTLPANHCFMMISVFSLP